MIQSQLATRSINAADAKSSPHGWRAADFKGSEVFSYHLTESDLLDLERGIASQLTAGATYQSTTRSDFDLASFGKHLQRLAEEVEGGRGFVLLRGLPVQERGKAWGKMATWAIGTQFGKPVSQTRTGTMMADVMDMTKGKPGLRGYNSNAELRLHTDPASDLIGLCCLETAKSGGESVVASSISVHQEIAARRPELLNSLYQGFFYHRLNEGPVDAGPISEERVPIFARDGDQVLCRYGRQRIKEAHKELGSDLSDTEQQALDFFNDVANADEFSLRFKLEPGDLLIANNLTTLHARTNFEDNDDPSRPRHLLRLWLASDHPSPATRVMNFLNHGECGIPQRDER